MQARLSTQSWRAKFCAAGLLLVVSSVQAYSPPSYVLDVYFERGSAAVTRDQQLRIQELACRVEHRRAEWVLAIGHADNTERLPPELALARARNVQAALAAAGIQGPNAITEGKADKQPVAQNNTPGVRAKNRRVEVEVLVHHQSESGTLRRASCAPAWMAQLLALNGREALVFARNQVREGWVQPEILMQTVIKAERLDLFLAFWSPRGGLMLDQQQRREVFFQVLGTGNLPMVEATLEAGWPLLRSRREPLAYVLCESSGGTASVVKALIARGAKPGPPPPGKQPLLDCAVPQKGLEVVQLLLMAGADPREVQGVVAKASTNRAMIDQLLAAGANPLEKLPKHYGGGTLFHVMPLRDAADIAWLQSLGLDINEKDAYGRTPLSEKLRRGDEKLFDALVAAGATLDEPPYGLLGAAQDNFEARLWLLRKGASLTLTPGLLVSWVREGERVIPVMQAYLARGGDINAPDHRGYSALAEAISLLKPKMVDFLLRAGADRSQVAPGVSAIAMTSALNVRPVYPCTSEGCGPVVPLDAVDDSRLAARTEIMELLQRSSLNR